MTDKLKASSPNVNDLIPNYKHPVIMTSNLDDNNCNLTRYLNVLINNLTL